MSSLTRSMGAAAVFETAAETPPTKDKQSVSVWFGKKFMQRIAVNSRANCPQNQPEVHCKARRTQEIDHEALRRVSTVCDNCRRKSCRAEPPTHNLITNSANSI